MMGNHHTAAAAGSATTTTTTRTARSQYVRRAHHAGRLLAAAAATATTTPVGTTATPLPPPPRRRSRLRGIIAPHAGYAYSGQTAAHSYLPLLQELLQQQQQQETEEQQDHHYQQPPHPSATVRALSPTSVGRRRLRILLLHPSHHVHLPGQCAVSNASVLETPLGDLTVDDELRNELLSTLDGLRVMTRQEDEEEHSGEMQYPYLAYCCCRHHQQNTTRAVTTVTPIMVGSLTTSDETRFGRALSAIIHRPDVITIVSTDFCHWGQRFRFQPMPQPSPSSSSSLLLLSSSSSATPSTPIHQFIEALDRRGMDLIAAQQPGAFAEYLRETRNTICGRHPIAVWLRGLESYHHHHDTPTVADATGSGSGGGRDNNNNNNVTIHFSWYAQSSAVQRPHESSVSYAAAIAVEQCTSLA